MIFEYMKKILPLLSESHIKKMHKRGILGISYLDFDEIYTIECVDAPEAVIAICFKKNVPPRYQFITKFEIRHNTYTYIDDNNISTLRTSTFDDKDTISVKYLIKNSCTDKLLQLETICDDSEMQYARFLAAVKEYNVQDFSMLYVTGLNNDNIDLIYQTLQGNM